jgi:hypothetical protein
MSDVKRERILFSNKWLIERKKKKNKTKQKTKTNEERLLGASSLQSMKPV